MRNLSNRWHVLVTPPVSPALLVPDEEEQMVLVRKMELRERKREKRQYLLGQYTCVVCGMLT